MDIGTILAAFLVASAAILLVALGRLGPADDDVAVVVAAFLGTPGERERPDRGETEEPVRWRLDRLRVRPADRPPTPRSIVAAARRSPHNGPRRLEGRPRSG